MRIKAFIMVDTPLYNFLIMLERFSVIRTPEYVRNAWDPALNKGKGGETHFMDYIEVGDYETIR